LSKRANLPGERILWIDWGRHLRTQTLARRLGVEFEEICYGGGRLSRYILSALQTIGALRARRPHVVIATNPSIVLGYLLWALRAWYGFKLVSDAHYLGVIAGDGNRLWQRLLDFYNARTDLVIVTNENHAHMLGKLGTRAVVCEDPLPVLPAPSVPDAALPSKSVFLICSFDIDEPYEAVFSAFKALQGQGYVLFVSGNYRRMQVDPARYPWVRFLGFVPEGEYYAYLWSCQVILDLTTHDNCLVCGGYEALVARKALVLSKTIAIAGYFGDAVLLTENTALAIQDSIVAAYAQQTQLEQKAANWVAKNENCMNEKISHLKSTLSGLVGIERATHGS
jgi:hypothetical protein